VSALTLFRNVTHWRTGERTTLAVEDGIVVPAPAHAGASARVFDAGGAVVAPGLVDLHVHLREPGQANKETIATGTRAAAAGGFTSIACMPNTDPVVDTPAWVEWVRHHSEAAGHCQVLPIAAVTMGQRGEQLAPLDALAQAGAVAFSDDGHPIVSAAVMRHALEYARPTGLPIICHEEDASLKGDGVMHEGFTATRLGLRGIPGAAESVLCRRDADLSELTGGRVHLAHLSASASFDALRDAKRRGLAVTGETCPHYWVLTDEAVGDYDTHAKMNPPLRSEADRDACIAAIVDGTIDCFSTDHAPHTADEKARPFTDAPFGIVGLETALALTLTHLVAPGHLTLARALERWTEAPRRAFRLPEVSLAPGSPADLVVFDPVAEWTVDPDAFFSKGRNTPFAGWRLRGRVLATMLAGRFTHVTGGVEFANAPQPTGASR
jgi:dihydroorotase